MFAFHNFANGKRPSYLAVQVTNNTKAQTGILFPEYAIPLYRIYHFLDPFKNCFSLNMITGISSSFKLIRFPTVYSFYFYIYFTNTQFGGLSFMLIYFSCYCIYIFPYIYGQNYLNRVRILYENNGSFWIEKNIYGIVL